VRRALWVALVVAALAAAVGVYATSEKPDGLERVSQDLGLAAGADGGPGAAAAAAPPRSRARRSLLALVGALAVAGVALGAGRLLARGRRRSQGGGDAP
jgi:hypothetical protein